MVTPTLTPMAAMLSSTMRLSGPLMPALECILIPIDMNMSLRIHILGILRTAGHTPALPNDKTHHRGSPGINSTTAKDIISHHKLVRSKPTDKKARSSMCTRAPRVQTAR